ncbi:Hypothetical predicted protein [Mytilus galloprovincialis]|uniref:Uncharacterized protein n=1 Tax=Mytilus galloprovincialis TaxID=29158 RepID=A0A8B6D7T6_MYTGA|nr:Hypothetical predicted protein [Mytilus galloprovincialis]
MKQQVKMKIYLFVSFYYVFTTIDAQDSSNKRRKIGAIFDRKSEHLAKTFEFEVRRLSNSDKDIHLEQTHEIVECQDSFHVSNAKLSERTGVKNISESNIMRRRWKYMDIIWRNGLTNRHVKKVLTMDTAREKKAWKRKAQWGEI